MDSKLTLNDELRKLVEARMAQTLHGIENTLQRILETQKITLQDLQEAMQSLEESFNLLSQKWTLQILYTLFLKSTTGFGELKKILGVNSRTLSDKLKSLKQHGYIKRTVKEGPPLKVRVFPHNKGKKHRSAGITVTLLLKQALTSYFFSACCSAGLLNFFNDFLTLNAPRRTYSGSRGNRTISPPINEGTTSKRFNRQQNPTSFSNPRLLRRLA